MFQTTRNSPVKSYQGDRTPGDLISTALRFEEAVDLTPGGLISAALRFEEAVDLKLEDHPDRASRLCDLGAEHFSRYKQTKALGDIELAIQQYQKVLDLTLEDHPDRANWLDCLATAYRNKYLQTEAIEDLDKAISRWQEALNLISENNSDRARLLQNLGAGYSQRYMQTRALEDLEKWIDRSRYALNLTPEDHSYREARLEILSSGYSELYRQTGALGDLKNTIQWFQELLDLTPKDHPDRVHRLHFLTNRFHHLAGRYHSNYLRTGTSNDLEKTIEYSQKAVNVMPHDYSRQFSLFDTLGAACSIRFKQTGALDDIDKAVEYQQKALNIAPPDHPDRYKLLRTLGVTLTQKHQAKGVLNDLEKAIEIFERALHATNDGFGRARILDDLSVAYVLRSKRTGVLEYLERAIKYSHKALDITSHDYYTHRINGFISIGRIYGYRYSQTGALSDLENSIGYCQEALQLMLNDHPSKVECLHNLGIGYRDRYGRTAVPEDLEKAVRYFHDSLNLATHDHPGQALRFAGLGLVYEDKFKKEGILSDIEACIEYYTKALNLMPHDHPDQAHRLESVGRGYSLRYRRTHTLADLDVCIQFCQQAMNKTPHDHPDRAARLTILGLSHRQRYDRTGISDDCEIAIQLLQEALNHTPSPPKYRLRSGNVLLMIYGQFQNWTSAYKTACLALPFVPLLTSPSHEHSDRQHLVREIVDLAVDAAAVTIRAEKSVYKAIELLETGRGIVASFLSDLRTDVTDLKNKYPHLAEQFSNLRTLLDTPKEFRKDHSRYDTAKQLEKLIGEIRSLPGFDRFLLAPSEDDLKRVAIHGPIVVINVSRHGCHALIIEHTGLRALELPLLQIGDVRTRAKDLANPNVEMLEWLWDVVASPVLNALNVVEPPKDTWPRIWWILTGPLARFPIHAAGRYSNDESFSNNRTYYTVIDRTISSYSSSIKAIVESRRNISVPTNLSSSCGSMVLVGMAKTEGYSPLPFVLKEVEVLTALGASMQLEVKQPLFYRKKETLSAISSCKIFHFAGHGHTNSSDPSQSALVLSDGRLTVGNIFDANLRHSSSKPFLAYLSACGTGQVKNDGLLDEGLHIIGACQLAGFQHAIGTLWEVNDKSCVEVARKTYEWIQKQCLSDSSVSEGLHYACRELRSQWAQDVMDARRRCMQPNKAPDVPLDTEQSRSAQNEKRDARDAEMDEDVPLHWVPYVHFGT